MHLGDANTSFFTQATREQAVRNSLVCNLDQRGVLMITRPQLTANALDFYTTLFRSREALGRVVGTRELPKVLIDEMKLRYVGL